MEFIEVVNNRRSIRKYQNKEISSSEIQKLVEAAQKAPSWKNSQVSKFYAVNSEENLEKFRNCLPSFNQNNTAGAGAYIVTTVIDKIAGFNPDGSYTSQLKDGYQFFDNGLQVENLCLAAYDMGLGTLIMGIFDADKIRKFCNIPYNEIIVSVIAVGYPDINPTMPPRKNLDDILKIM